MLNDIAPQSGLSLARAKRLRRRQTRAESTLWVHIRAKRFHGYKFRRQVPIGPFIVDFLSVEHRLVIEIDGESHETEDAKAYDKRREDYLRTCGFQILRFSNEQTIDSVDVVLRRIEEMIGLIVKD